MAKRSIKAIGKVFLESLKSFGQDKVPKLSGSLAYVTVFSMGPLLVVIIFLCGLFFGQEAVQGKIYSSIQQFIGDDAARQIELIIQNASLSDKSNLAATIGVITLVLAATAVFAEIQDSINWIWGIKAKPKRGLWKILRNRFLSFSLVVSVGFLLLVSLAVTTLVEALSDRLKAQLPNVTVVVFYILSLVLSFLATTVLFALIYKVLPDAKTKWRDIIPAAIVAGILFLLGKFAISAYIGHRNIGTTYGAAGSLVVLLLWVYYSSFILYFGAEFAKTWNLKFGDGISPNDYAVRLKKVEMERGSKVQDARNPPGRPQRVSKEVK